MNIQTFAYIVHRKSTTVARCVVLIEWDMPRRTRTKACATNAQKRISRTSVRHAGKIGEQLFVPWVWTLVRIAAAMDVGAARSSAMG
eukprot:1733899-Rhodomonas_salina.1